MKKYKVIYSRKSINKLNFIYDYIFYELKNPNAAKNIYNKIIDAVNSLDTFPLGNPIVENINNENIEIHRKLVANYSIFYTVKDDEVLVLTIAHSSCDINTILNR